MTSLRHRRCLHLGERRSDAGRDVELLPLVLAGAGLARAAFGRVVDADGVVVVRVAAGAQEVAARGQQAGDLVRDDLQADGARDGLFDTLGHVLVQLQLREHAGLVQIQQPLLKLHLRDHLVALGGYVYPAVALIRLGGAERPARLGDVRVGLHVEEPAHDLLDVAVDDLLHVDVHDHHVRADGVALDVQQRLVLPAQALAALHHATAAVAVRARHALGAVGKHVEVCRGLGDDGHAHHVLLAQRDVVAPAINALARVLGQTPYLVVDEDLHVGRLVVALLAGRHTVVRAGAFAHHHGTVSGLFRASLLGHACWLLLNRHKCK